MSGIEPRLVLRARLREVIRGFFRARGVLEVDTPVMSWAGNPEPNIDSFEVRNPRRPEQNPRWLRTSPEFAIKRLLAEGVGDCFELGAVMRVEEVGRKHGEEFTMLEWYRLGFDDFALMGEVADLLAECAQAFGQTFVFESMSYQTLFEQYTQLNPAETNVTDWHEPLQRFGINWDGLSHDDALDLAFSLLIEPALPANQVTTVFNYPASQCALAKVVDRGGEPVAARFEVLVGGMELANGFYELTDADEQRQRFAEQEAIRAARGQPFVATDERFLTALSSGMPECAGVALGFDRLLMALTGAQTLADVVSIPSDLA